MKPARMCSAQVRQRGMNFHRTRPCRRLATVRSESGWFCACHDPDRAAERKAKSDSARRAKRDLEWKIKMMLKIMAAKRK